MGIFNRLKRLIEPPYVSTDISDRLFEVLSEAESEALNIELENIQEKNRLGIPSDIQIPSTIPSDENKEQSRPSILEKNSKMNTRTPSHANGRASWVEEER